MNSETLDRAAANILEHHLQAGPGSEVAIVHAPEKATLAQALQVRLEKRSVLARLIMVDDSGDDLPPAVVSLLEEGGSGLILLASHRMWAAMGLSRYFEVPQSGGDPALRTPCSPVFFDFVIPLDSLLRLYASDYEGDRDYLARSAKLLPPWTPLRLTAPGGTDLTFTARDWQISQWTEIHTSPVEEPINGIIVADASTYLGRVGKPIELEIVDGKVKEIRCVDPEDEMFALYLKDVSAYFEADEKHRQLAEIGLGGSSGAMLSGTIMEDEAVRDTCHFCFGDNSRYGGENEASWHGGTVVVRSPQLIIAINMSHSEANNQPGN